MPPVDGIAGAGSFGSLATMASVITSRPAYRSRDGPTSTQVWEFQTATSERETVSLIGSDKVEGTSRASQRAGCKALSPLRLGSVEVTDQIDTAAEDDDRRHGSLDDDWHSVLRSGP